MPTFDKKRYRTDRDIMNTRSSDELETAYRNSLISEQADKLEERLILQNGATFYADLVLELARRELDKKNKGEGIVI